MTVEQQVEATPSASAVDDFWKPLDFCDLLLPRPFYVLGQNWKSFLTIALLASGLRALLAFVFDVVNGPNYGADYGAEVDYGNSYGEDDYQQTGYTMDAATLTMSLVNSMILFVVMCLADGACVQVVANMYAGQPTLSAVDAIGTVAEKGLALVGSCLLVSFGMLSLLFFVLVIPFIIAIQIGINPVGAYYFFMMIFLGISIYVTIVAYLMYPAIVVENKGVVDCIRRSIRLTEGYFWKIVAVLLTYGLIKMILGVVIQAMTINNTQAAMIARGVLSFLVNTFFLAMGAM